MRWTPWSILLAAIVLVPAAHANAGAVVAARTKHHAKRAPRAATAPSAATSLVSGDALLVQLHALIDALDYDAALTMARANADRDDLSDAVRRDVRYIVASSAAVLGDADAAEKAFIALLENDPSFTLPADVEPKIVTPYRSAQAVVNERRQVARAAALEQLRSSVKLELEPPQSLRGGEPAVLSFHLSDPSGAVRHIDLNYRRLGEPAYASLPLQEVDGDATHWNGEIPGDWTSSPSDYVLEFYAQTATSDGVPLTSAGASARPLSTTVARGQLQRARPFYHSGWFWAATAVGVIAAGVSTYVIIHNARAVPTTDLGVVHF